MNSTPRCHHVLRYFTPVSADVVQEALCHAPERIADSSICLCEPDCYRIDRPGASILLTLGREGVRTLIFAKFKSCAASLWQSLKKMLRSLLPLRREDVGPQVRLEPKQPAKARHAHSVAQVVATCMADETMCGQVVFSGKAVDLSSQCPFRYVEQVTQVFHKLKLAAGLLRGGLHHGKTSREFWHECIGLPVTFSLSETQERKYGADYDAIHDGRVIRGRMHVTLGSGNNPASCMSIHWAICEDCRAIIITRCGAHGRTARS